MTTADECAAKAAQLEKLAASCGVYIISDHLVAAAASWRALAFPAKLHVAPGCVPDTAN
jgi:hypothetical protein